METTEEIPSPALEKTLVRYKLGDMLFEMIRRHYDNRSISRSQMTALGFEQRYWNLSNSVLLAIGVRDPEKHSVWNFAGDSSKMRRFLGTALRVDEAAGLVECLQPDGTWITLDLKKCHFLV